LQQPFNRSIRCIRLSQAPAKDASLAIVFLVECQSVVLTPTSSVKLEDVEIYLCGTTTLMSGGDKVQPLQ
jgi:hypothetical protein